MPYKFMCVFFNRWITSARVFCESTERMVYLAELRIIFWFCLFIVMRDPVVILRFVCGASAEFI